MNRTFLLLTLVFFVGLILFLNGFLLTRRVILQYSKGNIPNTVPNDFNQVILVVIDALRYDFIKPSHSSNISNYQNQMPFVQNLLETKSNQSVLIRMLADPPTTTLQRLKALTTGTLPTFIDLSYNFVGYEIEEDNILRQLKIGRNARNISLLGDDTWLALYPNLEFQHLHVYPSFDVHDLDTVDNGILTHLWTVLKSNQQCSSFTIAHFLGVDHCGHRYGPSHNEMKRKLNQMDQLIRNITQTFDDSKIPSLLMVIGDHGMTQQGDHGGDEMNEIETAMFLYTNRANYFVHTTREPLTVSQIDLVPTLSWFLHSLIPFSSLGMLITDVIPIEQRYTAMKFNFQQMESYLNEISITLPLSDQVQELRANLYTIFDSTKRERNVGDIENLFKQYKDSLQSHFRHQWSTFNIFRIAIGLHIMFLTLIIAILFFTGINFNNLTIYFLLILPYLTISFSNSFIINEGTCLYYLAQTLILTMKTKLIKKSMCSFVLFLTRVFLICREEQQSFCVDPEWLISKSIDKVDHILPTLSTMAWFYIFISSSIHLMSYLTYVSYLSVVAYWFNIPYAIIVFYLSIIIQISLIPFNRIRFYSIIYCFLLFAVGFRFSLVIFLQYIFYQQLPNSHDHSIVLILSILSDYFFYASGHQPVFSQIRWTAAFPAIDSSINVHLSFIINSLFFRAIFVICETFSSQILNVICIRQFNQFRNSNELLERILLIDYIKLGVTATSVFLFKRHLMLWKIFCPRFLFQIVALLVKLLSIALTMDNQK